MASKNPLFLLYLLLTCLTATCRAADPTFYSIWPLFNTDGTNEDGSNNQAITDALQADLNNDPTKLFISRSDSLSSIWYWYAELTDDLVTKYQTFAGVSSRTLSRWNITDSSHRSARLPYPITPLSLSERLLCERHLSKETRQILPPKIQRPINSVSCLCHQAAHLLIVRATYTTLVQEMVSISMLLTVVSMQTHL